MQTLRKTPEDLSASYRGAISHFATGVTVITTKAAAGPAGMTASAVASLSLNPLQLLGCIRTDLPTRTAIEDEGRFVVNVLGAGAEKLALKFGSPAPDKFAGVRMRDEFDLPVLQSAIAYFVCDLAVALPGGDHTIMVGDVVDCGHHADAEPLVYFSRRFSELCCAPDHHRAWDMQNAMPW